MSENGLPKWQHRLVDVHADTIRNSVLTRSPAEEKSFLDRLRSRVVGAGTDIPTPYGWKPLRYFDFIASGRFHRDVEDELSENVLPFMANTHTETNYTGRLMTELYEKAFKRIAAYVHASENDILIPVGSGSTGAINRMINVLGLRIPDQLESSYGIKERIPKQDRPVIFCSLMEHHSNDIAWRETIGDVEFIDLDDMGCISAQNLEEKLEKHKHRPWKIGSFSAASNVTGILNDCHKLARVLHRHGAWAFFDYAAAGPYIHVDMHPANDPDGYFDAIFFSVHKFLGGPRTPGLLIADKALFTNRIPSEPGGGTVLYTSPWDHRYLSSIAERETGGTPPIVQSIQSGLAFDLKAAIGAGRIERIEQDYLQRALKEWLANDEIIVLGNPVTRRLGVVSLIFKRLHHNLAATLLNDLWGIQVRGGCMCAGPYGHLLLGIDKKISEDIRNRLREGHIGEKPGWVRVSFSPTVTEEEFQVLMEAVDYLSKSGDKHINNYELCDETGEWLNKKAISKIHQPAPVT